MKEINEQFKSVKKTFIYIGLFVMIVFALDIYNVFKHPLEIKIIEWFALLLITFKLIPKKEILHFIFFCAVLLGLSFIWQSDVTPLLIKVICTIGIVLNLKSRINVA
ncbi:MAG: hypothetical protein J0L69_15585 [Bacteroidetes bacterium]|nr:hypothetical protein [Bacteroidota bacterium]